MIVLLKIVMRIMMLTMMLGGRHEFREAIESIARLLRNSFNKRGGRRKMQENI